MIEITKLTVGVFRTNCYLVYNNQHVLIIDPGSRAEKIIQSIKENTIVDGILLTHGHLDHIGAVDKLVNHYHCPLYCGTDDIEMLQDPVLNCSVTAHIRVLSKANPLEEGKYRIGNFDIEIMSTPGHTKGSIMIQIENHLFSGDTLFHLSVGRTDLPTGSPSQQSQTLRFIKTLDPSLLVHPGHDEETTLETEFNENPYLI